MLGRDGREGSSTATSERRPSAAPRARVGAGLNTAVAPMLVALCLAGVFATCRLLAMDGGPSRFVVAGTELVDPAAAPRSLHVEPGHGYDGQFFHRLALAPTDLGPAAHGVRLDTALRRQRPG